MNQAILKPVTFDEFIDWYPENSVNRYELHNGTGYDRFGQVRDGQRTEMEKGIYHYNG
ncbi:hypothetical protein [Microcoleus sp. Pol12B4]|uniref:hypothetical protein n=1 Tax=Microcoleus sp. Pol12B4 TaxID=3055395 RepID=UPI0040409E22